MKHVLIALATIALTGPAPATDSIATLRGTTPATEQGKAPRIMPFDDSDQRQVRNCPEQPPVIPHDVEGYRIDLRLNKCLSKTSA